MATSDHEQSLREATTVFQQNGSQRSLCSLSRENFNGHPLPITNRFPYKIAQIETIKTVYWLPPQKTEKYKYRKTVALKNNEQAKKPFPLIYQSLDK